MSKRSKEIRAEKDKCNAFGHEMGNAVNISPFNADSLYTVRSTCRRCGLNLFIEGFLNTAIANMEGTHGAPCFPLTQVKVNGNIYDREFVERMDRILAFVASNTEAFPANVVQAYANDQGDGIMAHLGIEMFEGNEPEGEVPTEQELVDHSIHLLEVVLDDLYSIIERLLVYHCDAADEKEN